MPKIHTLNDKKGGGRKASRGSTAGTKKKTTGSMGSLVSSIMQSTRQKMDEEKEAWDNYRDDPDAVPDDVSSESSEDEKSHPKRCTTRSSATAAKAAGRKEKSPKMSSSRGVSSGDGKKAPKIKTVPRDASGPKGWLDLSKAPYDKRKERLETAQLKYATKGNDASGSDESYEPMPKTKSILSSGKSSNSDSKWNQMLESSSHFTPDSNPKSGSRSVYRVVRSSPEKQESSHVISTNRDEENVPKVRKAKRGGVKKKVEKPAVQTIVEKLFSSDDEGRKDYDDEDPEVTAAKLREMREKALAAASSRLEESVNRGIKGQVKLPKPSKDMPDFSFEKPNLQWKV